MNQINSNFKNQINNLNQELGNNFINNPNFKLENFIAVENNKHNNEHKTKSLDLCINLSKKIFYFLIIIVGVAFFYELLTGKIVLTEKYTAIFVNLFSTLIGFVIGKEFK